MSREDVRTYVNQYCRLRDLQFAAYELYARKYNLTAKELFVLDLIWFAQDGCLQSEICQRLSATKQTISAIIKKFWKLGYLSLTEDETDRRNKIIRFTDTGVEYAKKLYRPRPMPRLMLWKICRKKILQNWYASPHYFLTV